MVNATFKIKRVHLVVLLGFLVRLLVAVWNGFVGPTIGADLDAVSFHRVAVEVASTGVMPPMFIGWIYSYILGCIYAVTTPALFLGCLLSCLSWLASAIFLLKSMRICTFRPKSTVRAFLIYSFLPSSVLLTGVTLREPFQLMFVNMALFAFLKIVCNRSRWYWFILLLAVACMGALHGALIVLGIVFFVGTAWLALADNHWLLSRLVCLCVALVVCVVGLALIERMAYGLDDGLITALQSFRAAAVNGRASYSAGTNLESLGGVPFFVLVAFFQYMFEPTLLMDVSLFDVMVIIENCLRLWLCWRMLCMVLVKPISVELRPVFFVIFAYLVIEIVWAIGTTNWGTAVRHHIPSLGLLIFGAYSFPWSIHVPSGGGGDRCHMVKSMGS